MYYKSTDRYGGSCGEEAEIGSQARELKTMPFFEGAPSPSPCFLTVGFGSSLPVQVGTSSGTVTLPGVLKLQLASFQWWSHPEKQLSFLFFFLCCCGPLPQASVPVSSVLRRSPMESPDRTFHLFSPGFLIIPYISSCFLLLGLAPKIFWWESSLHAFPGGERKNKFLSSHFPL